MKVDDKRRFNPDGTPRRDGSQGERESDPGPTILVPPEKASHETVKSERQDQDAKAGDPHATPDAGSEIGFMDFIFSLATSVQVSLGLIPHPATHKSERDLAGAKQTIDILGMLEQKTKGNLDAQEARVLQQLVYELRMTYVMVREQDKK